MSTSTQPQHHPPLRRPLNDRAFAGVAAGLAQRFSVNPAWFRVGFVLLALAGGVGFFLYALGWLLIPDEGSDQSIAEGLVEGFDGSNTSMVIGVVLIGMAAVIIVSGFQLISGKFVVAGVLMVIGVLLYRGDLTSSKTPTEPTPAPNGGPGIDNDAVDDVNDTAIDEGTETEVEDASDPAFDGDAGESSEVTEDAPAVGAAAMVAAPATVTAPLATAPQPKPRPPKPKSILGQLTLAAILIVLGGLALLDAADVLYPEPVHYLAAAVGVIGGGLLIGTLFGRARWLVFIALALAPVLFLASFVSEWSFSGEAGERYVQVRTIDDLEAVNYEFDHAAGVLELDFRWFEPPAEGYPISVDARVSAGELRIWLPRDARAVVTGSAGLGSVEILGDQSAGIGVSNTVEIYANQPGTIFTIYARADFGSVVVDVPLENVPEPLWEG
ncbi:MAG: PspC domain-containing protein [Acidimicrobiia bacterium]